VIAVAHPRVWALTFALTHKFVPCFHCDVLVYAPGNVASAFLRNTACGAETKVVVGHSTECKTYYKVHVNLLDPLGTLAAFRWSVVAESRVDTWHQLCSFSITRDGSGESNSLRRPLRYLVVYWRSPYPCMVQASSFARKTSQVGLACKPVLDVSSIVPMEYELNSYDPSPKPCVQSYLRQRNSQQLTGRH
jgi:hypothetical protein